ncbi:aldo/keto reductase [Arthrobacter sp. zg-Y453]|uniref:Aldo/keto reductase n=2 Tax=Arthrobacter caoxuetaonis TaxID=2886935 RepID=A0A9X1MDH1_9MICC|nr:aldo/keto reductase [Arthrobacter caoxuetaonis]MCC3297756.1 aldo/keto reductase [Arthrobacter caoxuetaonis]USQ56049.1 aldo/keto reductase [Arthrobacter caoxuetaonis]
MPMDAIMPMLTLNNGVTIPALGFGVYRNPPAQTTVAVETALANGYRLIDTAAAYGNETEVGSALSQSGVDRARLFITTKLWIDDYGYDSALRAFDTSMAKVGLDTLDLYLLHQPLPSDFDATVASYQALQTLYEQGRVRAIGVSNFGTAQLAELLARTDVVPAVNQIEVHPYFTEPELRAFNLENGILTQAWSPIGGVNRYAAKSGNVKDPLRDPLITALAAKYSKTPAQIILRWDIQQGLCAIPKSVSPKRIAENIDIFDFYLTNAELSDISALDTGIRGGPNPEDIRRS